MRITRGEDGKESTYEKYEEYQSLTALRDYYKKEKDEVNVRKTEEEMERCIKDNPEVEQIITVVKVNEQLRILNSRLSEMDETVKKMPDIARDLNAANRQSEKEKNPYYGSSVQKKALKKVEDLDKANRNKFHGSAKMLNINKIETEQAGRQLH